MAILTGGTEFSPTSFGAIGSASYRTRLFSITDIAYSLCFSPIDMTIAKETVMQGSYSVVPTSPAFIAVDWGNSNARFFLVAGDGSLMAMRSGPGISQIDGAAAIESICFDIIGEWLGQHPALSVMMVGAVGSNIGWQLAGYAVTPATLMDVAAGVHRFCARGVNFIIAPGVATTRIDGLPDVMRGEEIQIFGSVTSKEALICLPGTHSKWAKVSSETITAFHTAHTGELLDILGRHSILLNPKRPVAAKPNTAFVEGVEIARESNAGFESLLFTVRSRQIAGTLKPEVADSYLAGIAIGCEIKSALALYGIPSATVTLVGSSHLTALYAAAMPRFGVATQQVDGDAASLSGLIKLYQALT
jgi:2-dehydro-3-deoxygalactonokinase